MPRYALITPGIGIQKSLQDRYWPFHSWQGSIDMDFAIIPGDRIVISSTVDGLGPIIVDNSVWVNGTEHGGLFAGTTSDPLAHIGLSAASCYNEVEPIDVTEDRRVDGLWNIQLVDFGYTYAASRLYLVAKRP